jgi:predicted SAM-dependent methyltransferase
LFRTDSISQMLAEHVWEHLTQEAAIVTAKNCFKHLRPGGHLRVAVPDGYHPDEDYIMYVKPGGIGPGCEDHKVLYTYKSFRDVFLSAGFKVNLLEYWDEDGKFHYNSWNVQEGAIMRSRDFDNRNKSKELSYTSIILDAIKEKP